ncbi:MAG: hypothetical protein MJ247_08035 [Alphaproteobacteria bacterium]|nr:hypothetical protein [Alphaproteobacteria bacterium]
MESLENLFSNPKNKEESTKTQEQQNNTSNEASSFEIIKNPNYGENDNRETLKVIRFGEQESDYFPINDNIKPNEYAYLKDLLNKIAESPAHIEKFRNIDSKHRPTLMIEDEYDKPSNGWFSSGENCICINMGSPEIGNHYAAAGTLCHEFQHFVQNYNGGLDNYSDDYGIKDRLMHNRIYEATADTSKYQFLYNVKDHNPQALAAFNEVKSTHPGMKAYCQAKEEHKPEQACILESVKGYTKDTNIAGAYAYDIINETLYNLKGTKPYLYANSFKKIAYDYNKQLIEDSMDGKNKQPLDLVRTFKLSSTGMTNDTSVSDSELQQELNAPSMSYVSNVAHDGIEYINSKYKAYYGGNDLSVVKNGYTLFGKSGFNQSTSFGNRLKKHIKDAKALKQKLDLSLSSKSKGRIACSITRNESVTSHYEEYINLNSMEYKANLPGTFRFRIDPEKSYGLLEEEGDKRFLNINEAFYNIMKDNKTAKFMRNIPQEAGTKFVFDEKEPKGSTNTKNEISLSPKLSAKELAGQIVKNTHIVAEHQKILKENPQFKSYDEYAQDLKSKDPEAFNKQTLDLEAKAEAEYGKFMFNMYKREGLSGGIAILKNPSARAYLLSKITGKDPSKATAQKAEVSQESTKAPSNKEAQDSKMNNQKSVSLQASLSKQAEKTVAQDQQLSSERAKASQKTSLQGRLQKQAPSKMSIQSQLQKQNNAKTSMQSQMQKQTASKTSMQGSLNKQQQNSVAKNIAIASRSSGSQR